MLGSTGFDFEGTTALITGSTKGIGRGIASVFADTNANIVVNARSVDVVEETATELDEITSGKALGVPGDLGSVDAIDRLYERAIEEFGHVDVLVNNAAVWPMETSMLEASLGDWDLATDVNVRAPFYLSQLVTKDLVDTDQTGTVVNVTSHTGDRRSGNPGLYGVSKSALNGLTWRLARNLAPHGIRVNAVSTVRVDTYQLRKGIRESGEAETEEEVQTALEKRGKDIPLGRVGRPEDVANAVLFLASEQASYITGDTIRVSGGDNLE